MKPTQEQILSAINQLVIKNRITQMSKVSRIDLGLADDVEKLTQQAKDLIPDITRDIEGTKVFEKNIVQAEKLITKREAVKKKADDNFDKFLRLLDTAEDDKNTAIRELKETEASLEGNSKSLESINKRLDKTKGKAAKTRSSLEKKLNALEKAAKDLGVKIPTGEAAKVLKKLISLL